MSLFYKLELYQILEGVMDLTEDEQPRWQLRRL